MTMTGQSNFEPFELSWTDDEADKLSKRFFEEDPFHDGRERKIHPSLLSADDIVEYVRRTAMVTPFYGTKKKLKHASYEDCIGKKAYIYGKEGIKELRRNKDGYLKIPANEIVFVESGVQFRLPRYIAARFNLQIKHVHRGLLLGTGPLVDPGFRGRLLIPLHNLTSEHYYIHEDDGFIWIEFTRTTYDQDRPSPYGDYPTYKAISDGKKWLDKAAFDDYKQRSVLIRSSIRPFVRRVEKKADAAFDRVKELQRFGLIAALTLVVTFGLIMLSEIYTNRSFMQNAYGLWMAEGMVPALKAGDLESDVQRLDELTQSLQMQIDTLRAENAALRGQFKASAAPSAEPSSSR
ncbi:hypothetical protein [Jiella pacifica]|uniref:Deoxycytidine triphosphate deaminase n=1 Tax=Jiella pacifica TaxID=2696469 RepID=A0A6N9T7U7_9HYPH|nr:hypothetical protein [Jiella pacifica]NDW07463.1 hypothetical protein [Jiella pacifica]